MGKTLKKSIIIIIVILIVLLGMEVIFRIITPKPEIWRHWGDEELAQDYNSRYQFDSNVGFVKLSVIEELKTIQDGFRILVLGDSVAELGGVCRISARNS